MDIGIRRTRDITVIIAALLVSMFMVSELGYVDLTVGEEPSASQSDPDVDSRPPIAVEPTDTGDIEPGPPVPITPGVETPPADLAPIMSRLTSINGSLQDINESLQDLELSIQDVVSELNRSR